MGQRTKAEQAVAAFLGERPTLGERIDATRAANNAAAHPAATGQTQAAGTPDAVDAPTDMPADRGEPLPMPPPDADGSWAWVRLPDGSGLLCARAIAWLPVTPDALSPTGWALWIRIPCWRMVTSWTGRGGHTASAVEEYQLVPSTMASPVPGHWTGVPRVRGPGDLAP